MNAEGGGVMLALEGRPPPAVTSTLTESLQRVILPAPTKGCTSDRHGRVVIPTRPSGWEVRPVPAHRAHKDYTCPNCGNPIRRGVGHVVAWPDQLPDLRRHWHHHCWRVAVRAGRMW